MHVYNLREADLLHSGFSVSSRASWWSIIVTLVDNSATMANKGAEHLAIVSLTA